MKRGRKTNPFHVKMNDKKIKIKFHIKVFKKKKGTRSSIRFLQSKQARGMCLHS